MSDEMRPLFCTEHGEVMRIGPTRSSGVEMSVLFFCPVCRRELFTDDPLGEIERGGRQPVTFDEWKEAQPYPVLEIPAAVVLPDTGDQQ